MITLENVLHRFEQFATAHLQIKTFSHGQITDLDIFKNTEFPVMHVVWNGLNTGGGTDQFTQMVYNFQILFLDQPHIQDNKTEQAKFAQSDCVQYGIDLLAAIQNGEDNGIFNDDFVIANASFDAVTESFTNVLWGALLNLGLQVDLDYNLCDAPLSDISGGFTPCTLCGLIADSTALQIVQCLSEEQEAAVSALICEAAGTATYSNGGAFTVDIDPGDTYTAPKITVTDVDGSERSSLPNIPVVCEWAAITAEASDGYNVPSWALPSYPSGGVQVVGDFRISDADGVFGDVPARERIAISNARIDTATTSPSASGISIEIDVNVPVQNSNGDTVGSNVDDLLNPHVLPDLPLTDDDGAVGSYPMPTALVIDGEVDSASYLAGTLTIVPVSGVTPSGIAYAHLTPGTSLIDGSASGNDVVALWQAGSYTITNPATPAVFACLDPSDAARTTLLNDNFFGNKYRYTDTAGNPSSVGTTVPSRIDWLNHDWSGAVQYIVIDHLHKAMLWVRYIENGSKIDVSTGATGDTWYNWLAYIAGVTLGGYTGWLPIMLNTQLPHAAACDAGDTDYKSFFISHRVDNRVQILTGESYTSTRFYPFIDSSNGSLISSLGTSDASNKAGSSGFRAELTAIYAMRIMSDAEIAALTP